MARITKFLADGTRIIESKVLKRAKSKNWHCMCEYRALDSPKYFSNFRGDYVIRKVPKNLVENPGYSSHSFFYLKDTLSHFSSLGLFPYDASKILHELQEGKKVYIEKATGNMLVSCEIYSGVFKSLFSRARKKPRLLKVPKNTDCKIIKKKW